MWLPELMLGRRSTDQLYRSRVFTGPSAPLTATRYHSLGLDPGSILDVWEVTASAVDGAAMGVRHREVDVKRVQIHPGSILTAAGHDLLCNFPDRC